MKRNKINISSIIVKEPEYVLNLIANLKENFETVVYPTYNRDEQNLPLRRNFESFYIDGHSISFARIMKEIFGDLAKLYDDFSSMGHVIVKIGEHFYDARGIVDYLVENNPSQFNECEDSFPFYEDLGNHQDNDEEIKNDLIIFGKVALQDMLSNRNDTLMRKLTVKNQSEN